MAVIEARDGYHLVSPDGVRLPGLYRAEQLRLLNVPAIVGVNSAPPQTGRVWPGSDVQAGLALVRHLAGEPWTSQIEAIDVGRRDSRNRLRLVIHTDDGQVRWGLPPGQAQPVEPSARTKLQWLRRVAQRHDGQIDAGGKVVHLYGATVQVSQPELDNTQGRAHRIGAYTAQP